MANWLIFTRTHYAIYRGTRGLIGGNLIGIHMLLLTTQGRKTGKTRTLPLAYIEDQGDFVVVASNGGADTAPAWWHNLKSAPETVVQVGGERFEVTWEVAAPAERIELWRKLQAAVPAYRMYRHRTGREIPIVRLRRQSQPTSSRSIQTDGPPEGWRAQPLETGAPSQVGGREGARRVD